MSLLSSTPFLVEICSQVITLGRQPIAEEKSQKVTRGSHGNDVSPLTHGSMSSG